MACTTWVPAPIRTTLGTAAVAVWVAVEVFEHYGCGAGGLRVVGNGFERIGNRQVRLAISVEVCCDYVVRKLPHSDRRQRLREGAITVPYQQRHRAGRWWWNRVVVVEGWGVVGNDQVGNAVAVVVQGGHGKWGSVPRLSEIGRRAW